MLTDSLEQARAADLHEHAARAYCNLLSLAVVQRRHADAEAVVRRAWSTASTATWTRGRATSRAGRPGWGWTGETTLEPSR